MKLLIVTQVVDRNDPVLGFFHRWIEEFAQRVDSVEVICLFEGAHDLPENVRVHSLGKERGRRGRLTYALRFLRLAWSLRGSYDAVFVHMNQEYVLIAGWLWKLLGKRIYMWRNHYAGSLLTDIAAAFCTKVFCTSRHSYTAKYGKTVRMPVGVDTERFTPGSGSTRRHGSILFLARMAPSKNPHMLLEALRELRQKGIAFTATFVGSPLPEHAAYHAGLIDAARRHGLEGAITFKPGVPHGETIDLYRSHELFVNCSRSGMFDKTLFEAAACGCVVLAASEDFAQEAGSCFAFTDTASLTDALAGLLAAQEAGVAEAGRHMRTLAERHALTRLADALTQEMARP